MQAVDMILTRFVAVTNRCSESVMLISYYKFLARGSVCIY